MYDDDLMLPKATVVKAIKQRLPENMKIANESSEMIMECCNNFIHIITSTANEISENDKRSTIQPEDVLQAVKELGFDSYVQPLEEAFQVWKSSKKEARNQKSKNSATSGMSQEELIKMQQQLFQQAKDRARADVVPPPDGG
eukprot:jgi/Picsp_1/5399/NSC_02759-R1_protein dr1